MSYLLKLRIKPGASYRLGKFLVPEQYLLCWTREEEILGSTHKHCEREETMWGTMKRGERQVKRKVDIAFSRSSKEEK